MIYPTTYTYDLEVKRTTRIYTEVIISTDFQSWMEMYSMYLYIGVLYAGKRVVMRPN